ncbi:MAG: hypothetical protein AAGD86_07215 [Pseudomonadota bacterium]
MNNQQPTQSEYREPSSDAADFAGWDPYVIWLCKQFTAPMEPLPAEAPE